MSTLSDLRPGDIGFANIVGAAGVLVWAGQKLLAATERGEYKIKHVFVVTQGSAIAPKIVQAMPSGAEEIHIDESWLSQPFTYVRPNYPGGRDQGFRVAEMAQRMVGTPYSFLDYAAILGLHAGVKNGLVWRRVKSSGHMICSQLADQAMADAGWHVFDDGRLPQDVMPIELYRKMRSMPGWTLKPVIGADWVANI